MAVIVILFIASQMKDVVWDGTRQLFSAIFQQLFTLSPRWATCQTWQTDGRRP